MGLIIYYWIIWHKKTPLPQWVMVLLNYDNIIANNKLMKLNWSIVIAPSIIIRFSCLVVMWCITILQEHRI